MLYFQVCWEFKATKGILIEFTKGTAKTCAIMDEILTVVIESIKNFTNYMRKYGEDDKTIDVGISKNWYYHYLHH